MMTSVNGDRESTDDLVQSSRPEADAAPDLDARGQAVWRQWLHSMAEDAEAALAAAIAYRELDSASRESFLDSLELDAPKVDAPPVALYAPLLSVERDPERRCRMIEAIGHGIEDAKPRSVHLGYSASAPTGEQVHVLVIPLYLDFVQVLCCVVRDGRFLSVKHDPIVSRDDVPLEGMVIEGARLERTPFRCVIDELATAVVSHQRGGGELPEALMTLADLLAPGD